MSVKRRLFLSRCVISAFILMSPACVGSAAKKAGPAPSFNPAPPGGYVALDYDKPGGPPLTASEAHQIRAMLDKVKPCQRSLLRYGYWGTNEVALFFAIPPVDTQGRSLDSHILGATNEIYIPKEGTSLVVPGDSGEYENVEQGLRWDIAHHPCPSPSP